MALTVALVETELQQRLKSALGTFTTDTDHQRLQMAYMDALRTIWHEKEWRFKNKTFQLACSSVIGKGPYTPPADFYKLAQRLNLYRFAFDENQILAPVKDSSTSTYFLWIDVQTGGLFFEASPGDVTLTLNYQAEFDNDVGNIGATLILFPGSVMIPLYHFTKANLFEDLPAMESLAEAAYNKGLMTLEKVWQDYNQGQVRQRQMAPRGLHGGIYDGMADPIPLRGPQRFWRRY